MMRTLKLMTCYHLGLLLHHREPRFTLPQKLIHGQTIFLVLASITTVPPQNPHAFVNHVHRSTYKQKQHNPRTEPNFLHEPLQDQSNHHDTHLQQIFSPSLQSQNIQITKHDPKSVDHLHVSHHEQRISRLHLPRASMETYENHKPNGREPLLATSFITPPKALRHYHDLLHTSFSTCKSHETTKQHLRTRIS